MFSRQRKARVLFALSDFVLISLAYAAAYETRLLLPLARQFYMTAERAALVLGFAVTAWVLIGLWLEIYDRLDSVHPRVALRDSARQCVSGAVCLALLQYSLRLYPELSRPFLALFCAYAWVLLLLFRLTARGSLSRRLQCSPAIGRSTVTIPTWRSWARIPSNWIRVRPRSRWRNTFTTKLATPC